jgi:rod shape-determining protein MreD
MNTVRMILAALFVLTLQMTVARSIAVAGAPPDLLTVLLVILVLERSPVAAVVIGFVLGILQDLGDAHFLGMNALAKSVVAYGVARLGGGLLPENVLYKGFIILAASLSADIIVLAVTTSFSFPAMIASFFRYSLIAAVYAALVGMAVIVLIAAFTRRVVRVGGR